MPTKVTAQQAYALLIHEFKDEQTIVDNFHQKRVELEDAGDPKSEFYAATEPVLIRLVATRILELGVNWAELKEYAYHLLNQRPPGGDGNPEMYHTVIAALERIQGGTKS